MRLLFCGDLSSVSYATWQRAELFAGLGFQVSAFDTSANDRPSLLTRLRKRLCPAQFRFPASSLKAFNAEFLDRLAAVHPQVVWGEKLLYLQGGTLERARRSCPGTVFVCCQEDNPFGARAYEEGAWREFVRAIPLYDLHFVKRTADLALYAERGARNVILTRQGYFPALCRPYPDADIPPHRRHDVVFIGTALDHRVASIARLIGKDRLPVHVYGGRWNRHPVYYRHRAHFHGLARGRTYAQAISGSRICLGFVSSSNLDEFTLRSSEIPACGGFLLAERTPTHQAMYREGEEAEFFGSEDECADKIRFYLRHDDVRRRIARAGHERCLRSDYSLTRHVREAATSILELLEHPDERRPRRVAL